MKDKYLIIIKRNRIKKVNLDDVLMVERKGRKLFVYTSEEIIDYNEKLENVIPGLDERFFPCLQSCYVNFTHVIELFDQMIMFDNGMTVMLGETNFLKTKRQFIPFLKKEEQN